VDNPATVGCVRVKELIRGKYIDDVAIKIIAALLRQIFNMFSYL